jgi:hypothetical protein
VAPRGVLYVGCQAPAARAGSTIELHLWEAATQRDRVVATLQPSFVTGVDGMSASPDGRIVLYAPATGTSELMMIENFR